MPSNPRFPPTTSKLKHFLTPRPPRPCLLPLQSILQPAGVPTPGSVRARLKSDATNYPPITSGWTGTSTDDHAINRTRKGDITDPQMESALSGQEERAENEFIADRTKSQATTERDLRHSNRRAKEENPEAPEPIIGMNDEKGEVSLLPPSEVALCSYPQCLMIGFMVLLSYRCKSDWILEQIL